MRLNHQSRAGRGMTNHGTSNTRKREPNVKPSERVTKFSFYTKLSIMICTSTPLAARKCSPDDNSFIPGTVHPHVDLSRMPPEWATVLPRGLPQRALTCTWCGMALYWRGKHEDLAYFRSRSRPDNFRELRGRKWPRDADGPSAGRCGCRSAT